MPLLARAFVAGNGDQKVEVWFDRKLHIVDPPFLPYCYSNVDLGKIFPNLEFIECKEVAAKPISAPHKTIKHCYKYSFRTTKSVDGITEDTKDGPTEMQIFENHVKFLQRIRIDRPEWYSQFKQTKKLRIMTFDIETLTKNAIQYAPIISIAVDCNGIKHNFMCDSDKTLNKRRKQGRKDYIREPEIIMKFVNLIKKFNPDVIVGYNCLGFDFPRILQRMKDYKMDTRLISRDGTRPRFYEDKEGEYHGSIGGRLIYDVSLHVFKDQQLDDADIKNFTLGSIAKHFGFDFKAKIDVRNTFKFINSKNLRRTNMQDVAATKLLFGIYWPTTQELAEYMKIPLDMANRIGPLDNCTILQGTELHKEMYVADNNNWQRYPTIFAKARKNYQAAIVLIGATGHFKKVKKVDFSGMYSAMELGFNLSPETTRFTEFRDYKDELPTITRIDKNHLQMVIPDNIINKNVVIVIDTSKMGMLPRKLQEIRGIRYGLKKKMKLEKKENKKRLLKSRQGAYKLLLNLPSGTNGNPHMSFGDLAVTIGTVGMSRLLITEVAEYLKSNQCLIIEIDTDGIYFCGKTELADVVKFLAERLKKYGLNTIPELDSDFYPQAFFLKMKNYILYTEDGTIIPKGSALKGKHRPRMFDNAIERIADVIFRGKEVDWDKIADANQYPREDLYMRRTMGMPVEEYTNQNDLSLKLYRQAVELGWTPPVGTQFEFYKSESGYRISQATNVPVDSKYYRKMIEKVLKLFDKNPNERTLAAIEATIKDSTALGKELSDYM